VLLVPLWPLSEKMRLGTAVEVRLQLGKVVVDAAAVVEWVGVAITACARPPPGAPPPRSLPSLRRPTATSAPFPQHQPQQVLDNAIVIYYCLCNGRNSAGPVRTITAISEHRGRLRVLRVGGDEAPGGRGLLMVSRVAMRRRGDRLRWSVLCFCG
jgi:hypothetical protein